MRAKIYTGIGLAVVCSVLAACGSTQYLITTKTGAVIEADGKPKIDSKTGMVTYENKDGKEMQMPQADIGQIIER